MFGAESQINAATGSLTPFRTLLAGGRFVFENVDGATKGVQVLVSCDLKIVAREQLHWIPGVSDRDATTALVCQSQGIGPKIGGNCVGPTMFGVNDHGACAILKVAYLPLRDSVLKVGVDTTERESLSFLRTISAKGIVGKASVVAMVLLDGNVMSSSKQLECVFGCEGFDGAGGFLHVEVSDAAKMIHEDGCTRKTLCGWVSLAVSNETRGRALKLID